MRRERLGFKSDEGLIVKSPETEIVAKVELQNNGTAVASLMKWDEVIELDEQANEEKSSSKKKLIAGMILFLSGNNRNIYLYFWCCSWNYSRIIFCYNDNYAILFFTATNVLWNEA